jgi:hypothetical protein
MLSAYANRDVRIKAVPMTRTAANARRQFLIALLARGKGKLGGSAPT